MKADFYLRLAIFAFFLPLALPGYLVAEKSSLTAKPAQIRAELVDLRQRSNKETKRLAKLNADRSKITKDLEKLQAEHSSTKTRQNRLRKSIISLGEEAQQVKLLVFAAKLQMEQQRSRLEKRLVAIYKAQRRAPHSDYLFQANSANDLLKRAHYLSSIAEHDQAYIDRLYTLVKKGQDDRDRLENLLAKRRSSLLELKNAEASLEKQKRKKAELLREQDAKAEQQKVVLSKLQASADRLEKMLSQLMGEAEETTVVSQPEPPSVKVPRGLARSKGKLSFPVAGTLVQKFGKQKHKEFTDMLFKKGLEIRAANRASVRSVAAGKVLFIQDLPGYGRVVIVDHGRRYYTLYGRLGETRCKVGQMVEAGEEVAILGPVDRDGRNFYFELRIRGKATNPIGYFAKPPKAS